MSTYFIKISLNRPFSKRAARVSAVVCAVEHIHPGASAFILSSDPRKSSVQLCFLYFERHTHTHREAHSRLLVFSRKRGSLLSWFSLFSFDVLLRLLTDTHKTTAATFLCVSTCPRERTKGPFRVCSPLPFILFVKVCVWNAIQHKSVNFHGSHII